MYWEEIDIEIQRIVMDNVLNNVSFKKLERRAIKKSKERNKLLE